MIIKWWLFCSFSSRLTESTRKERILRITEVLKKLIELTSNGPRGKHKWMEMNHVLGIELKLDFLDSVHTMFVNCSGSEQLTFGVRRAARRVWNCACWPASIRLRGSAFEAHSPTCRSSPPTSNVPHRTRWTPSTNAPFGNQPPSPPPPSIKFKSHQLEQH